MEIKVHAPKVPENWKDLVLEFVQDQVARGVQFKKEQTIQIGWMWFVIKEKNDQLVLHAPRLGTMPWIYDDDCSNGLGAVMTQKFMAESFGCPLTSCHCRQSALILKNVRREDGIFMNRIGLENMNDSGWFIGSKESKLNPNEPGNLEQKSLWEISCQYPETLEFWQLGENWQVVFEDLPIVLQDCERAKPLPGSYYESKFIRR